MAFGALKGTLTGNGASIGTSNSLTGSVSVAVLDLVFVVLGQQTNLTATGASSSLVTSYSAQNAGTDAGAATGRAFYGVVTSAGTLTSVSVAASSSTNDWCGLAAVIEGPFVSSPIDTNPANITSDVTSPFTCPATGTLAQADEAVICWGAADGSTTWAATSPNLLAGNANNSTNIKVAIGYQAVSATSSVQPAFTAAANPTVAVLGTCSFKKDLTQALIPSLYSDSDTFFTPTVTPGAVALTAPLYSDDDTFFTSTVSATYALTASAIYTDADTFFTPTVSPGDVNLTPSLFSDGDTIFSHTASASYDLTASLFSDGDTFHTPTVEAESGDANLQPSLYSDADTFFSPTVTPGEIGLTASLFSDGDAFHSPTVTPGAISLTPSLYSDADTFFSPAVARDGELVAELFVDGDTFHSPTVLSEQGLVAGMITFGAVIYSPSVALAAIQATGSRPGGSQGGGVEREAELQAAFERAPTGRRGANAARSNRQGGSVRRN